MKPDEAWQAYRVLRLDRRIGYSRRSRNVYLTIKVWVGLVAP